MQIDKNTFFNSKMKMQFLSEYQAMDKHYSDVITDDYVVKVQEILLENFS